MSYYTAMSFLAGKGLKYYHLRMYVITLGKELEKCWKYIKHDTVLQVMNGMMMAT